MVKISIFYMLPAQDGAVGIFHKKTFIFLGFEDEILPEMSGLVKESGGKLYFISLRINLVSNEIEFNACASFRLCTIIVIGWARLLS